MTTTLVSTNLYACLLHLYPGHFRAEFGVEMTGVFEAALNDAGQGGFASLLSFWLHELVTLIPAALTEHLRESRRTRHTPEAAARFDLLAARWIARIVSLLICSILLDGFGTLTSPVDSPAEVIQIVGLAGLLLAWRWEELGGLLVMLSGAVSGVVLMGAVLLTVGPSLLLVWLLGGLAWAGPFLIFGWLFIKIGRHNKRLQHHRPGAA